MSKITIACAALSGRIYAGKVNKAGTAFLDGKQDVTSDVLKAVIDKIKPGHIETVTVDGSPRFEIEVRDLSTKTSSLIEDIQTTQVRAGENAVLDNLAKFGF